jgi:hypothetical protein
MKKKVMILIIASILTVGGISVAYAAGRNDTSFNNINRPLMSTQNRGIQSNDRFNNMIKIMKDNGLSDEANALANRDFGAMNKIMTNLSDADYKKMIDIMQNNGYGYMANMMQSVSRADMTNIHNSMMGR